MVVRMFSSTVTGATTGGGSVGAVGVAEGGGETAILAVAVAVATTWCESGTVLWPEGRSPTGAAWAAEGTASSARALWFSWRSVEVVDGARTRQTIKAAERQSAPIISKDFFSIDQVIKPRLGAAKRARFGKTV